MYTTYILYIYIKNKKIMIKVVILLSQVESNNNESSLPPLPNHSSQVHFLKNLINVIYPF